jgi:hypothetical protein
MGLRGMTELGERLRSAAGPEPASICTPAMIAACGRNGICWACRRQPDDPAAGLHCWDSGCMAHRRRSDD